MSSIYWLIKYREADRIQSVSFIHFNVRISGKRGCWEKNSLKIILNLNDNENHRLKEFLVYFSFVKVDGDLCDGCEIKLRAKFELVICHGSGARAFNTLCKHWSHVASLSWFILICTEHQIVEHINESLHRTIRFVNLLCCYLKYNIKLLSHRQNGRRKDRIFKLS